MLHHRADVHLFAIRDRIHLRLRRVLQELIDQHRILRAHLDRGLRVIQEHLLVVHDLHAAATEHEGRTDHQGIADPARNLDCRLNRSRSVALRLWYLELQHHLPEELAILR